jgi:two-component system cell cycle response regulator
MIPPMSQDGDSRLSGTLILTAPDQIPAMAAEKPATEGTLVLIYPPGPHLGRRYPLKPDVNGVGRLSDADVSLDVDSVSRSHAQISFDGKGWYVEDLGSTNGSFVNDERVSRKVLRDGDLLRFGVAILKFLTGSNIETSYHEEIYRMTIQDGLTGVHNKRYFLEFLDREIARAQRYQQPLSLVMFDIDHFKKINDQHGHLAGDSVLREMGRRLRARMRKEDLIARYGGEEFACVLTQTALPGAMQFAEHLRDLIAKEKFRHEALQIPVTISLGVALLEPLPMNEKVDPLDVIRRADENLYAAKHGGRNRVVG